MAAATFLHGLAVIASGVWNRVVDGGEEGLWFGLVMGGLSLLAGGLLRRGRGRTGAGVAAFSALTVGGWFAYEGWVRRAEGPTARMVLMVLASGLLLVLLGVGARKRGRAGADGVVARGQGRA